MNNKNYFFDTYAIIEIIKGNENYNHLCDWNIITSLMNLAEVYYALLLIYNKETVDNLLKNFNFEFLEINPQIAKESAIFRHKNKNLKMSYIDCVGYILALNNGLLFLTGDKAFERFENVEFIKA
ncbi:PIN domain-containing protein [Candidatus Pacearchaeota archaeon]|nr:PIN domain-containing protein [Candidatus Pacearchaeota archaeon]